MNGSIGKRLCRAFELYFSVSDGGLRNIYAHAIETIINKQNIHGY